MSDENTVQQVMAESGRAAVYAMDNVTSSNGALSGAKKYFAEKYNIDYADVDGTLFTKGYGPADKVAAVKYEE